VADSLDRLASIVVSKLGVAGVSSPRKSVIRALLEKAYLASLRTEEGRFVRGSLTYADPHEPEIPPLTRRADYPGFTTFDRRAPLTVEVLVKLSRAIDQWSASIAVYGKTAADLFTWGVVDQLVHANVFLNRETVGGFANPGRLTVTMDAVGALSVFHRRLFLGGLRQDQLITRESDGLGSEKVYRRITPAFEPVARAIVTALKGTADSGEILSSLFWEWSRTVQRLSIGLRRLGTGGAFLMSRTRSMTCSTYRTTFPISG